MDKLSHWQSAVAADELSYGEELERMDRREALYRGTRRMDDGKNALHVRNVVSEMIESQVRTEIPQPRVTARRPEDEKLAQAIEDMLRCELDRLPFEQINDMMERTVPIQGGGFFLVEWDSSGRGDGRGELSVTTLHPKQVIPQAGVYTGIETMDHITVKLPQTREHILSLYGKDIVGSESDGDTVTQYVVYYRNGKGGIGKFSWVEDTVLEDMEDYQGRADDEKLYLSRKKSDGTAVPGARVEGERVVPNAIPAYRPCLFPVILQKNVSLYGAFLGDSDADKISDQQNTIKRLSSKMDEKLMKAGSYMTLPDDASIRTDGEDMKIIRPGTPANKAMIDVYNMQADISGDMEYMSQVYEESRQIIGITDSFQGRRDVTAVSAVAKKFAAAQSAGRMQSKAVLKNAAYAELFELMFKFVLACDEGERPVVSRRGGDRKYGVFRRFDFLEDRGGILSWNDRFLFSADDTSASGQTRQELWKENRLNLETGAYGRLDQIDTLIMFWGRMEELRYPGATEVKTFLEKKKKKEDTVS